ncbi:filamentous hemagglutinin N-terminal domain-containing protein [uncultured Phascolarctobacterium sp.]|uniref:filamentous hemagglutinin N-terminal domain-containing protein n=1 Tax=Phascolarctobacterium sp. TaxID=2049039 RepID=UPI0025EE78B2|nr:filamentous hemagglutinin N-terminal domain-containing protein [uncultured Phascolarctobacterium sp.]
MKSTKQLLYKKIMLTVLSSGMLLLPNWSFALPQGGTIVGGSGSIAAPGNGVLDIIGNNGNLAIDWNSFNIAAGETVNFKQMAAVLNYVTGNQRSEIFGKLNSDPGTHVFLLNPNGILFGAGAQVNVGSLTASTRSLVETERKGFNGSLGNLMADAIGKVQADIVNLGSIAADKITFEGNNISIVKADTLKVNGGDYGKVTLKAKNAVNIGYEVTDTTQIDVGDGQGKHTVSDYKKGGGTKASTTAIQATDLSGTKKDITDCMLIKDVYDLQAVNNNFEEATNSSLRKYKYVNGNYMLAGDIDASVTSNWNSGKGFASIGGLTKLESGTPSGFQGGFTGTFDGAAHTIKDLHINRTDETFVGLFGGLTDTAAVMNLKLTGSVTGKSSVGGIAGRNLGLISNVTNGATVVGERQIGGITSNNEGRLEFVMNTGNVTGIGDNFNSKSANIGGIAGTNQSSGIISNAENTGIIVGGSIIGGIVGDNATGASIEQATNKGLIQNNHDGVSFGGISGVNRGSIKDVINAGEVKIERKGSDAVTAIAGISGSNFGEIKNAINTGAIHGMANIGGIVGTLQGGSISNAYNTGDINGTVQVIGGIVGSITSSNVNITNIYNTGKVSGPDGVGGLVGYVFTNSNTITITNGYNLGVVEYPVEPEIDGGSIVGGGYAITINNVYFKTDTGYQKYGDGTVYATAAEFNAAFAAGLDEAGKAAWKVDNRQDAPYLQAFLEKVSGDVGVVEAAPGADLKALLLAQLQAQGITLDADKLLGLDNLQAGEYDLSTLLYSTQDGYDLALTGRLVIKDQSDEPAPMPVPDATDAQYSSALSYVQQKEKHSWERGKTADHTLHLQEARRIQIDGSGINLEEEQELAE